MQHDNRIYVWMRQIMVANAVNNAAALHYLTAFAMVALTAFATIICVLLHGCMTVFEIHVHPEARSSLRLPCYRSLRAVVG